MPSYDYRQRYRGIGDASMRHRGTYIGLLQPDGIIVPQYIEDVGGRANNPELRINEVDSSRNQVVHMADDSVIMERPEVGMANLICSRSQKTYAVWFESNAQRQIKRSLDFNLISKEVIGSNWLTNYFRHNLSINSSRSCKIILDCFYNNRYPRYTECLESLRSGRNVSMAFCKRFALCSHPQCGIVVMYKDIVVGYIVDSLPELLPQFSYLAESIEESSYAFE